MILKPSIRRQKLSEKIALNLLIFRGLVRTRLRRFFAVVKDVVVPALGLLSMVLATLLLFLFYAVYLLVSEVIKLPLRAVLFFGIFGGRFKVIVEIIRIKSRIYNLGDDGCYSVLPSEEEMRLGKSLDDLAAKCQELKIPSWRLDLASWLATH